jgi:hypothetical protein
MNIASMNNNNNTDKIADVIYMDVNFQTVAIAAVTPFQPFQGDITKAAYYYYKMEDGSLTKPVFFKNNSNTTKTITINDGETQNVVVLRTGMVVNHPNAKLVSLKTEQTANGIQRTTLVFESPSRTLDEIAAGVENALKGEV